MRNFLRIAALSWIVAVPTARSVFGQQALTNDSIAKMAQAGLGDDVIYSMVAGQPGNYVVTPEALTGLKKAGVSERVLGAMVAKGSGATVALPGSTPAAPAAAAYDMLDSGVYEKVKGEWVMVPSELVNWKTGGVLKSFATNGIVKGDMNGRLNGPASKTNVNTPLEFLIKVPDGVEATDYQLVHLHEKSDSREFRTMTGGVFHSSGGDTRDAVAFEQKQIARHTYSVSFTTPPPPGQYAFLAPGLSNSSASGSTGKAYSFHLVE